MPQQLEHGLGPKIAPPHDPAPGPTLYILAESFGLAVRRG
jgi:hypothetical protein